MPAYTTKTIDELTDTLIDYRGKTPPKDDHGVRLVTAKVIKDGFIVNGHDEFISESTYRTWMRRGMPRQWDILVTTEAPLGEVAQLRTPERVALAQRVILLRGRPNVVDQQYYFQALKSPYVQAQLRSRATGTTVAGVKQSELRKVEVPLFPLPTQRSIGQLLSAYDDLIENNLRRIRILEEMARSLYHEWFVKFRFPGHEKVRMVDSEIGDTPQDWRVATLSDLLECHRESTAPGTSLRHRRYVPIDCIPRRSLALLESKSWEEARSSLILFEPNDILFGAMRPYFHKVAIAPFAGVTRTTCFVLRQLQPHSFSYATLLVAADDTVDFASQHTNGATIPYAMWDGALASMPVLVPSDAVLTEFERVASPMLARVRGAYYVIKNLRQTRDLLLPKLISGEVDVSDIEVEANPV